MIEDATSSSVIVSSLRFGSNASSSNISSFCSSSIKTSPFCETLSSCEISSCCSTGDSSFSRWWCFLCFRLFLCFLCLQNSSPHLCLCLCLFSVASGLRSVDLTLLSRRSFFKRLRSLWAASLSSLLFCRPLVDGPVESKFALSFALFSFDLLRFPRVRRGFGSYSVWNFVD